MKKPNAISLYSGAGGLDFGFETAGFSNRVALEIDTACCRTLSKNRKWKVINADILRVPTESILDVSNLKSADVDIIFGGPPCQPFSKSGFWANGDSPRLNDPRAKMLPEFLRVVEEILPKTFLIENVSGLAFKGKSEGLDLVHRLVARINSKKNTNYKLAISKLSAADYGVPQLRERIFIVASRDGKPFVFPKPTHYNPFAVAQPYSDNSMLPFSTAWDAIGNVINSPDEDLSLKGKWADLLKSIPEGENYLWHTSRGGGIELFGWRRRYWCFLLKLAKNRPSWTIQAQPGPATGPFHWENRLLSMRELCRLQTFPDDVIVIGKRSEIQRQIGNAVPSLLAEIIAREIRTQLLGYPKLNSSPILLPKKNVPVPPPTRILPVSKKYLNLKGSYDAHPGTGLGYRSNREKIFA